MKRKRILALALTFIMVFSLLPVTALADEGTDNVAKIGDTEYTTLQEAVDDDAVAQIGSMYYATLEKAIAAAQDGDTVKLLKDYDFASEEEYLISGKKFTLDMNGKTVTVAGENFRLVENSEVTVTGNGTLDYTDGEGYGGYAFVVTGNSTLIIKNGTFTATMTIAQAGAGAAGTLNRAGTVIIYDGLFETTEKYADKYWPLNKKDNTDSVIQIYGGTFINFDPSDGRTENPLESFVAPGYKVNNVEDVFTVVPHYVAEIGSNKYISLQDAIAAAQDGDTVKLLDDITITGLTASEDRIIINKDMTLNLNGKTLEVEGNGSGVFAALYVLNGAILTIDGEGTLEGLGDSYGINVGYIKTDTRAESSGYVVVKSGTIKGSTTAIQIQVGEVTIEGGTFKVVPYEGSYKYTLNCIDASWRAGKAIFVVKGGSFFKYDPADSASENPRGNFVAPGYQSVADLDYFKVSALEGNPVAQIGNNGYATLEDAIAAAQDGDTVKLLKDYDFDSIDSYRMSGKKFTLDMNGKTVTVISNFILLADESEVTVTGNGAFTFDDEYTSGYKGYVFVTTGNSKLIIENGSYRAAMTIAQAGSASKGTVIIKSGTFETTFKHADKLWTLNKMDNTASVIQIYGGTFINFDPSAAKTENPEESFVASGYVVYQDSATGRYIVGEQLVVINVADVTSTGNVDDYNRNELIDAINAIVANFAGTGIEDMGDVDELSIELKTLVGGEDGKITSVTYNVTPMKGETAQSAVSAPITFRLAVPSSWFGTAKVIHNGVTTIHTIYGEAPNKYIEVSSDNFSEFVVESNYSIDARATATDRDTTTDGLQVYADDTVTVTVTVNGGTFVGAAAKLTYDATKFELVGALPVGWDNGADGEFSYYSVNNDGSYNPNETIIGAFTFKAKALEGDDQVGTFGFVVDSTFVAATYSEGTSTEPAAPCDSSGDEVAIILNDMTGVVVTGDGTITYNGQPNGITVTGPAGSTVTYSDAENGTYTATSPTITNVGTRTVYYKVTQLGYKTVTGNATITITAKEVTVVWNVESSYTYTGTGQTEPTAHFVGVSGNVACGVTLQGGGLFKNAGDYTFTASYTADSNYSLTNITKDVTIDKCTVEAVWAGITDRIYTAAAQTHPTATFAGVGDDAASIDCIVTKDTAAAFIAIGDYSFTAAPDNDNYTLSNATVTVKIVAPAFVYETSTYASEYNLLLIYSNGMNPATAFTYDSKLMFNVSGSGYKYDGSDEYTYIFAAIITGSYDAGEVGVAAQDDDYVVDYTEPLDVNISDSVDIRDAVAVQSVYNGRGEYYTSYMKIVLKSDVNFDKQVDALDFGLIKAVYIGS